MSDNEKKEFDELKKKELKRKEYWKKSYEKNKEKYKEYGRKYLEKKNRLYKLMSEFVKIEGVSKMWVEFLKRNSK